jgi:hypothetical protein
VKAHVPVYENRGTVQLTVSSSSDGEFMKPLFTRELAYTTGG